MSALVQRALREPVRFDRDLPGADRRALEALVVAGKIEKRREDKTWIFAPVVSLAEFRAPKTKAKPKRRMWADRPAFGLSKTEIAIRDGWKTNSFAQGKFRMMIDGAPCYFAAHVKGWKAGNKAALCKGYDPWGLELERPEHNKRQYWFAFERYDPPSDAYWQKWREVKSLESFMSHGDCVELINNNEYRRWRPQAGLFQARRDYEYENARRLSRQSRAPTLFAYARIQRRIHP